MFPLIVFQLFLMYCSNPAVDSQVALARSEIPEPAVGGCHDRRSEVPFFSETRARKGR
jgi:hypothetical protein